MLSVRQCLTRRLKRQIFCGTTQRPHSSAAPLTLEEAFNGSGNGGGTVIPSLRSFQAKSSSQQNKGLFLIPQLTGPGGFAELRAECADRVSELVAEATDEAPMRSRLVAAVFDDMSDELCRVADMAEFMRTAHPDAGVRRAAEEACIDVSGLVEKLNTHTGLYKALKSAVEEGDSFPETEEDKHVAKLFLLDFQQSGIHLDDEDRQMVVRLLDYALQLGQQFAAGAHRPSEVSKSLVPEAVRRFFHSSGDRVVLGGLHVDSQSELVRSTAYRLYHRPDPRQEELLSELLLSRARLAGLCGYDSFAHRALAESLAGDPESVAAFLRRLGERIRPSLEADFKTMLGMKRRFDAGSGELQVWDVPYLASKAKANMCSLHDAVSEYFSLGTCMEGLNRIFGTIFGVELAVEETQPGEVWHEDVRKLAVREIDGGSLLGHIYCDFFARPGKPHQDCHFTIRGGRRRHDGSYQNPAVVLMLCLPPAGWGAPCLLSAAALDNLFHEMGHAMHSMLGRTGYQHVTGTRCSTDFAEVPSTLMEYFASDPSVLCRVGKHYRTGQPLPRDLADKFCSSKKVFCSVDVHTQLFYSLADQHFHSLPPSAAAPHTSDIVKELHQQCHPLPYPGEVAWQHRFSHLTGYGARYYSYLMARAVAASIWRDVFLQNGDPLNGDAGRRYRGECLAHGGGKPSAAIVSDLLGASAADPAFLADAVVGEVEAAASALKRDAAL